MEQLAAQQMSERQAIASAHRLADASRPARQSLRLAVADHAFRLARRLDREGCVVPAALAR
jgi:hypothetical protein